MKERPRFRSYGERIVPVEGLPDYVERPRYDSFGEDANGAGEEILLKFSGELSARARKLLVALLEVLEDLTQTNATNLILREKTKMCSRSICLAFNELEALGIVRRECTDGRDRIVTLLCGPNLAEGREVGR
jgi:hypothetical protein